MFIEEIIRILTMAYQNICFLAPTKIFIDKLITNFCVLIFHKYFLCDYAISTHLLKSTKFSLNLLVLNLIIKLFFQYFSFRISSILRITQKQRNRFFSKTLYFSCLHHKFPKPNRVRRARKPFLRKMSRKVTCLPRDPRRHLKVNKSVYVWAECFMFPSPTQRKLPENPCSCMRIFTFICERSMFFL